MIDLALAIVLAGFAVYRAARMVATEEGPGSVFLNFRNRHLGDSWIDRGLHCPLCVGFWFALGAAITVGLAMDRLVWVIPIWFAIAGVQTFLQGREKA